MSNRRILIVEVRLLGETFTKSRKSKIRGGWGIEKISFTNLNFVNSVSHPFSLVVSNERVIIFSFVLRSPEDTRVGVFRFVVVYLEGPLL